jgi:hypothetical protein
MKIEVLRSSETSSNFNRASLCHIRGNSTLLLFWALCIVLFCYNYCILEITYLPVFR